MFQHVTDQQLNSMFLIPAFSMFQQVTDQLLNQRFHVRACYRSAKHSVTYLFQHVPSCNRSAAIHSVTYSSMVQHVTDQLNSIFHIPACLIWRTIICDWPWSWITLKPLPASVPANWRSSSTVEPPEMTGEASRNKSWIPGQWLTSSRSSLNQGKSKITY